MTLELTISTRPEPLLEALVDWLAQPSDDPFAFDVVVVPNAGMREWASAEIVDRLGVLSNVEFIFPGELARRSIGLPAPADDAWRPERLAWHVLALMEEGADLGRTPWRGLPARPWSVARRVADLLERYAAQRPDLIGVWLEDRDAVPLATAAHGWQPVTWSAVRERVGVPSSAERLLAALETSDEPETSDGIGPPAGVGVAPGSLPARLAVLGVSTLSAPAAAVLAHISRRIDVLVLATAASRAAFTGLTQAARAAGAGAAGAGRESPRQLLVAPPRPRDLPHVTHPLLLAWGRPALESVDMLVRLPADPVLLDEGAWEETRQLGMLQAAVRDGHPAEPSQLDRDRDGDGSIQVHACHGLVRQLEVLRDAILHAMAADATLLPRDIAVLCADLEAVAPLAVPILGADIDGRSLPVMVTDRAATTAPPVQTALDAALALATSRLERDEVMTFLSLPAVSAALDLDDEDLALLERMADVLDVRWGQDGRHRGRWGYPSAVTIGTWREALDRLLAGLLLDVDGELVGGLAPAVGVGTQDLGRVGRLADALAVVAHLSELAEQPLTMADWAEPLRWLVDTLLRPHRAVDAAGHALAAQAAQVSQHVEELLADALASEVSLPIDVREVRAALADRVTGVGSRARLRTGHVSVASLAPLRGVPFRLVAVVGVDDAMVSGGGGDDDDLLADAPRLGERDASDERRSALLDAVSSARDVLIVTCDGQDVRTGRTLDLPTVVEELLDAVPAPAESPAPGEPGIPLVVRHPRHLADRRNLTRGASSLPRLDRSAAWTFMPAARRALEALEAAGGAPAPGSGVLTESVPGTDRGWRGVRLAATEVEGPGERGLVQLRIDDVVDALRSPARVLLRERLGMRLPRDLTSAPRPVELWVDGHVERWSVGEGLLAHLIAGGTSDGWLSVRPAHGGVPPGALGRAFLTGFIDEVEELHELAGRPTTSASAAAAGAVLLESTPVSVELDVDSAAVGARRVRLVGSLPHVDGTHVDVSYSRDHPSALLRAGVSLLAAVAQGERPGSTAVVGARVVRRAGSDGGSVGLRELEVRGDDELERSAVAQAALARLVDLVLRVRTGAAPLLRRSAWSIDAGTDITRTPRKPLSTDVDRDLSDLATRVVLGVSRLEDLADQVDGPLEVGLPDAATPVQRWSLALRAPFEDALSSPMDAALASEEGS